MISWVINKSLRASLFSSLLRAGGSLATTMYLAQVYDESLFAGFYSALALTTIAICFLELGSPQLITFSGSEGGERARMRYVTWVMLIVIFAALVGVTLLLILRLDSLVLPVLFACISCANNSLRAYIERIGLWLHVAAVEFIGFAFFIAVLSHISFYEPIAKDGYLPYLICVPQLILLSLFMLTYLKSNAFFVSPMTDFRSLYSKGRWFSFNGAAFILSGQVDVVIANYFGGDKAAIYILAKTTLNQVSNVIFGGVSRYINVDLARNYSNKTLTIALFKSYRLASIKGAVVIAVLLAFLMGFYFDMLFPQEFSDSYYIFLMLMGAWIVRFVTIPLSAVNSIAGYMKEIFFINIFSALVLTFSCVWVSLFGFGAYKFALCVTLSSLIILHLHNRLSLRVTYA